MRGHKEELSRSSLEKIVQAERSGSSVVASMVPTHMGAGIFYFNLDVSSDGVSIKEFSGLRIGEYAAEPKRHPDYDRLLEEACDILGVGAKTPQALLNYFMEKGNAPTVSSQAAVQLVSGFLFYLAQIDKRLVSISKEGVFAGAAEVTHIGLQDIDLNKMQKIYGLLSAKAPFEGYKGFTRSEG